MSGTITHRYTAIGGTGKDRWNDSLVVSGGTTGQLFQRDTGATDGWSLTSNPAALATGVFGHWSRSGTTIRTATAGDSVVLESIHADLTWSSDWLTINRTETTATTSVGLSFNDEDVAVFTLGLDYQLNEVAVWMPTPGDVWRIAPNGQMTMGATVGTPTVEVCHFIMKGLESLDYVIGWRHGLHDVCWMDKNGVLTIPYLKAASGTRYVTIDAAGTLGSSASAPVGT